MKKSFVKILFTLLFISELFLLAPIANATDQAVLSIPAGSYMAAPGGTITIPIDIDVSTLSDLPTDIGWDFTFNSADISSVDWVSDSQADAGISGGCSTDGTGCVSGSSGGSPFSTGEIEVFQITLASSTLATSTNLTLSNITAYDKTGNNPISIPIIANPASTTLTINQPSGSAPIVTIGSPSTSLTNSGPVSYPVTYAGATSVTLINGNVTLNKTGTANGTVNVTGGGTATPTVTISNITGDGTLGIAIAAGTSSNTSGSDTGAGPSTTFNVDNTPPNNQNIVFPSNQTVVSPGPVTIVSSGDATNTVWFAPAGTTTFVSGGNTMTEASGTATSIFTPGTAGNYKLFVVDLAGNISPASIATLTVTITHIIAGTIKYYDNTQVLPNVTVTLEDGSGNPITSTTTDSNGTYSLTNVADGGNYIVVASKADATTTGESAADEIKIARQIVGLELFDTIYKNIAGDVNLDGILNSADEIKIARHLVGLDALLPSGAWKFYSSSVTPTTGNYLTTGISRTYTNLTSDASSQNFVGIKMGDTNLSWPN